MDAHPHNAPAGPITTLGSELLIDIAHAISHKEAILCVNFSQDGKYLAAGSQDGKSYIYDVQTGNLIQYVIRKCLLPWDFRSYAACSVLSDLLVTKDIIATVCFSPDGEYLATGSSDGSINASLFLNAQCYPLICPPGLGNKHEICPECFQRIHQLDPLPRFLA